MFLLPTIVYVAFVYMTREEKPGAARVLDDAPLIWLFIAGVVLVVAMLATFGTIPGGKPGQVYIPPAFQERPYRARASRIAAGSAMARAKQSGRLPDLGGAEWLKRPETRRVFAALAAEGAEARAVGGAVRNALMGTPVKDIDIATTALPADVMRLSKQAGLHAVPTGFEHGTVTVVADHVPFEVTTLRKDIETFGRHARVTFTTDWSEDALRRDFTMNALYCGAEGTVHDPLGGYADLVARRVRFIGDARQRIREDYLRILRFFRFLAEYGGGAAPDPEGLAAAIAEKAGLAGLSGERIRTELLRLLGAPGAVDAARAMRDAELAAAAARRACRRRSVSPPRRDRGGARVARRTPCCGSPRSRSSSRQSRPPAGALAPFGRGDR